MKYLLNAHDDYEDMRRRVAKYHYSAEFGQPLDKAIGVHMCSVIHKGEGKNGLIDSIMKPELFLSKYNMAAIKANEIQLNEEILEKWLELWS